MPVDIDLSTKNKVAHNFSCAATQYDKIARLQKSVVADVCKHLPVTVSDQLLDLGCGTADIYNQLNVKPYYTGLDLADGMLKTARHKFGDHIKLVQGDAESLTFDENTFDYVSSSLALQWCNLARVLQQVNTVIKPQGKFVFSTLLAGSMVELHDAWAHIDQQKHINTFEPQEHILNLIDNETTWQLKSYHTRTHTLKYPSVLAMMKELKGIGANKVVNRTTVNPLSKGKLAQLEQHIPADSQGFKQLTWQTLVVELTNIK